MNAPVFVDKLERPEDSGLAALCGIAGYFRISADAARLRHELALGERLAGDGDLVRAAQRIGLKARIVPISPRRLATVPVPALVQLCDGTYNVFAGRVPS